LQTRQIFKFGPFGLEPKACQLLKEGEPVRLTRKAAETLLVLVEHSPNVVSKEELLSAVWPDQFVDEHNLTQSISMARRALGVPAGLPGSIETFPGHGYRILGPVSVCQEAAPNGTMAVPGEREAADATHAPEVAGASPADIRPGPSRHSHRVRVLTFAAAGIAVASLALAIFFWRSGLERTEAPRIVPLSRQGGRQYQPVVSPDGKTVAFLWQKENADLPRIWLQNLHESTSHPLTRKEGEYSSPAWSPDGRSIACLRFREHSAELVTIELAGGNEHLLAQVLPTRFGLPHRHLDWSTDGQWIAIDDAPSLGDPLAIYLVNVKTGDRTRITRPDDRIVGDVAPRFSPDGNYISFIRVPHRVTQELWVVPRQGGTEVVIDSSSHEISDQLWLPNPPMLVFASNRSGEFRIWKTRPVAPKEPGDIVATAVYGEFPIQFSTLPGRSGLVYSVLRNDRTIWRFDLAGKNDPPATRWKRLIAFPGQNASPQYSPDGSRIAFRSDRGGKEELWVSQADGSAAFPITEGPDRPSVPRWAPDSHSVVFNVNNLDMRVATDRSGKWEVRSLGVQGTHPVYSPDGKWIYAGSDTAILRYPAEGGTAVTVVPVRGISIDVSPDGGWLYFSRQTAGTLLWSFNLATRQMTQVLDGLVPYCSSCWVPTAGGVYFLGARPGGANQQAMYFHDFNSSRDSLVAPYPEPIMPIGVGPFSLSPDRRYLLTVRSDPSTTDLLLAEPFR
jgi:Tol biopolymer transport system component/DNA-binding winged helix-turn-helix (wHTH) protein